jgi:hypothetical protein
MTLVTTWALLTVEITSLETATSAILALTTVPSSTPTTTATTP